MSKPEEKLINFRCNVDMLEIFGVICKDAGIDTSKALRGYMVDCVDAGVILKRDVKKVKTSNDFRDNIGNIHSNFPRQW